MPATTEAIVGAASTTELGSAGPAAEGAFDLLAYGLVLLAAAGGLVIVIREKERQAGSVGDFVALIGLTIASFGLAIMGGLCFLGGGVWWLIEHMRGRRARRRYREETSGGRG